MRSVKGKTAEENEAEIEMSNDIVYTDNPLQNMSGSKDFTSNNDEGSRVYELEMEITDVKTENNDLKTENTSLKAENTILQQKIKELESKSNDNNDKSNADL